MSSDLGARPKMTILEEADRTVLDREHSYGSPTVNHQRTAEMWSAYLGYPVSAIDVCMLNILQKISRWRHRAKRDNLVDLAGYARNAEIILEHYQTTCSGSTKAPGPSN